mgnify:CR=1 FL=1
MTTTFCLIFFKAHISVSVCNVMEESYILATSPNVQPGGGQGGSVTVEPLTPVVGDDNDELVG